MGAFVYRQEVLFRHCDPAGIMFFPRMFEVVNDTVERFFAEVLHWSFAEMHPDWAVPTAAIATRFLAPCRMSEQLEVALTIQKLGRTSMTLQTRATVAGAVRFETDQTLVCIGPKKTPALWPDHVRRNAETYSGELS